MPPSYARQTRHAVLKKLGRPKSARCMEGVHTAVCPMGERAQRLWGRSSPEDEPGDRTGPGLKFGGVDVHAAVDGKGHEGCQKQKPHGKTQAAFGRTTLSLRAFPYVSCVGRWLQKVKLAEVKSPASSGPRVVRRFRLPPGGNSEPVSGVSTAGTGKGWPKLRGFGVEAHPRGLALPRLQKKRRALPASFRINASPETGSAARSQRAGAGVARCRTTLEHVIDQRDNVGGGHGAAAIHIAVGGAGLRGGATLEHEVDEHDDVG